MQPFVPPKSQVNKADLIALRKKQAAESAAKASPQGDPLSTALARAKNLIRPEDAKDKLRLIFDNSSSMSGQRLSNAKEGVVEFLKNCTPNSTAIAIHLLNSGYEEWSSSQLQLPSNVKNATMSSDLILYASEIVDDSVEAIGGTPLYTTIEAALDAVPVATRLVAFTDGESGDHDSGQLKRARAQGIPIDTVFVSNGYSDPAAIRELKHIAEFTGGIFLDLSKGNVREGLKYLAPTKRLMLMDSAFKAKLERGEIK
jgi:hypothetical protein